jgi:hypothetical protein
VKRFCRTSLPRRIDLFKRSQKHLHALSYSTPCISHPRANVDFSDVGAVVLPIVKLDRRLEQSPSFPSLFLCSQSGVSVWNTSSRRVEGLPKGDRPKSRNQCSHAKFSGICLLSIFRQIQHKSLIIKAMEVRGFEPLAFSLRTRRSTN